MKSKKWLEKAGFNATHPELKDGEMWLINTTRKESWSMEYKYKRLGLCAYTLTGAMLDGSKPLFVKISEFEATQI